MPKGKQQRIDMLLKIKRCATFLFKVTMLDTETLKLLEERPVVAMSFASDQPCLLLVAHGPVDDFRSYLTIWNISSPSQPQHVLVTSGYVRTVCFSPTKASMAFAGMMDGSISVWDLRESYTLHQVCLKHFLVIYQKSFLEKESDFSAS